MRPETQRYDDQIMVKCVSLGCQVEKANDGFWHVQFTLNSVERYVPVVIWFQKPPSASQRRGKSTE